MRPPCTVAVFVLALIGHGCADAPVAAPSTPDAAPDLAPRGDLVVAGLAPVLIPGESRPLEIRGGPAAPTTVAVGQGSGAPSPVAPTVFATGWLATVPLQVDAGARGLSVRCVHVDGASATPVAGLHRQPVSAVEWIVDGETFVAPDGSRHILLVPRPDPAARRKWRALRIAGGPADGHWTVLGPPALLELVERVRSQ